jgi:hypothetical protein
VSDAHPPGWWQDRRGTWHAPSDARPSVQNELALSESPNTAQPNSNHGKWPLVVFGAAMLAVGLIIGLVVAGSKPGPTRSAIPSSSDRKAHRAVTTTTTTVPPTSTTTLAPVIVNQPAVTTTTQTLPPTPATTTTVAITSVQVPNEVGNGIATVTPRSYIYAGATWIILTAGCIPVVRPASDPTPNVRVVSQSPAPGTAVTYPLGSSPPRSTGSWNTITVTVEAWSPYPNELNYNACTGRSS